MNILILSSISPFKSANYGKRLIDALTNSGHSVHYLTKYKFAEMEDNMFSVFDEFESETIPIVRTWKRKTKEFFLKIFPFMYWLFGKKPVVQSVIALSENNPVVDAKLLADSITQQYDVVIVTFWQFMLNTKSLKSIYDKLHCPILMSVVDMFPMTGGCYYFADCDNYKRECLNCPVSSLFDTPNIPHENFLFKKNVYNEINGVYLCNTWMKNKVLESGIISEDKIKIYYGPTDLDIFKLYEKKSVRQELGLPTNSFIMFAGADNIRLKRKGFNELRKAVNDFVNSIKDKNNVLLVLACRNEENLQKYFDVEVRNAGFLSTDELARMYSAADLYLSPSLDDAGPSMVVQSLTCGTPVIAFNVGVAIDVVESGTTGYRASLGDAFDFSSGIKLFYNMDNKSRERIQQNCRELMERLCSPDSFVKQIEDLYQLFRIK